MKRIVLFLFLTVNFASFSQVLILDGHYNNKNLYIQNPHTDSGYCVQKVFVNDQPVSFENESAFVIRLDSMNLKQGEKLCVKIIHHWDCKPSVINNIECFPAATFELVSMEVDSAEVLHWTTKNEKAALQFIIEQFRWNKWIEVGVIMGKGEKEENSYSYHISSHSGMNQFRLKQKDGLDIPHYTKSLNFKSAKKEIKRKTKCQQDEVCFSDETAYEVYDQYGYMVLKGNGSFINISKLSRGSYFLNYDNQTAEFNKY
jgi:hypothetical protein